MTDETKMIHDDGATMPQEQADALVASMKDRQPRSVSRLTVVESVYHQCGCDQPTQHTSRYAIEGKSDESPYVRQRIKVGVVPEYLDFGYLNRLPVALVVIENTGKEELVLAVGDETMTIPTAVIRPGRSMRFEPAGGLKLFSRQGDGQYTIKVFPE